MNKSAKTHIFGNVKIWDEDNSHKYIYVIVIIFIPIHKEQTLT